MLKLKLSTLASWWEELTRWKRPWCWERLKVGGEGDDRGWDGWMASPTRWTWVWASSGSWWWTGKPVVLQSMGLQRVRHDWATELNELKSCLTLRDPMECNLSGSSVHGISQARILGEVAIFLSTGSSWPRDQHWVSCIGRRVLYHWFTREARHSTKSWFHFLAIVCWVCHSNSWSLNCPNSMLFHNCLLPTPLALAASVLSPCPFWNKT